MEEILRPAQQGGGAKCQPSVSCSDGLLKEDSIRSMGRSGLNLDDLQLCVFVTRLQEEVDRAPQWRALLRALQRNE